VFHPLETVAQANLDAGITLSPDVVFVMVQDGTGRLLDLGGNFYGLSDTGARMLSESLDFGLHEAAERISRHYRKGVRQIERDLEVFLHRLQALQLVRSTSGRSRISSLRECLSRFLLFPLFHIVRFIARRLTIECWVLLAIARISFRVFGWSASVHAWQRFYEYPRAPRSPSEEQRTARSIDEVVRSVASRHIFGIRCKERALCCWVLLRSSGIPVNLVLGINLFPLSSHCWCEYDSAILSDDPDRCETYIPILFYK